uniref:Uncharacterized protein n=1 Tax=Rhizophora mucronata TaxID=61149 RepID=A0A2P2N2C0_RHIMU
MYKLSTGIIRIQNSE